MNTKQILLNTALVAGLTVTGLSMAADAPVVTPVLTREEIRAQHQEATAGMTQEERDLYRTQVQAEMTAEQRAELRASSGNADKGKGIKARDGSATGSQRMGSGSRGAGGGQGMGR